MKLKTCLTRVWLRDGGIRRDKTGGCFAGVPEQCLGRSRRTDGAVGTGLLEWTCHYLPEHFTRPASAMHRWLAERLDEMISERGGKLNVLGPRGAAKSTVGTLACPLRLAVEGWEPYVWIVSDTKHQAASHLENIKAELLQNPILAEDYPQAVGRGSVWRENSIVLRNGVAIEAYGTGQKIRGKRRRANRPTWIVCDDLQNDQHIDSALMRDHCRRWFHSMLLKAGTKRTNVVNLATALHREALGLELHRTPGWTSRLFRAIERWPDNMLAWQEWEALYVNIDDLEARARARQFFEEHRQEMEAGVELLWPEEEDLYTLMCMRAESGKSAFEREKQGSPIQPELCEWPESYFTEKLWFETWPRQLKIKTLALDPSKGTDSRRGDYSAFVVLGVDERNTIYVEADLARRPTPQIVADGVELHQRFRPDAFAVEANQFQELLGQDFADEFRRQGLLHFRPWTLDNQVSKLVRIRRLGPYLASGQMKFKDNSPGTRLLVEQLKEFPVGDHDDGPDALEMALRLAVEMSAGADWHEEVGGRLVGG